MAKKKTTYTWVILIFLAISIVYNSITILVSLISIDTLLKPDSLFNPVVNVINLVLSIIGLVIMVIFFFKLYNVTSDIIKWTHISFGYSVFGGAFVLINSIFTIGLLNLSPMIIALGILVIIWNSFVNHLKKAKREKLMDFS
jgi:mannose/fructose/N-acetylgalactosamine-specific phosphotransferase system component IID